MENEEKSIGLNKIKSLVAEYNKNINQYSNASYGETQLRIDFINPFFEALGWDVNNKKHLPQHIREVVHEANVSVEEGGKKKKKKPDYSFKIGHDVYFFVEAKKPAVDITKDSTPSFQLRRYGWSGNLKISILTNFTDLHIYDCTVRPTEKDGISTAKVAHYSYTDYVDKFDEIYELFSKEAIITGSFERHFSNIKTSLHREPFDVYFLKQIREWRFELGQDAYNNNPNIDVYTLNIFVQRLLNRIIFLRICEDRSLEEYEKLRSITTYKQLKDSFAEADKKFDSGLFELLEEDKVKITDASIINIFQSLYYPKSSYEFSVVDPYIIGQIYELFLGETLVIADGHIKAEYKPEVIDSSGAVNTPKYITDVIVQETLTPLFNNANSIQQILEIKVADICCGSGNFLLSTYEFFINNIALRISENKSKTENTFDDDLFILANNELILSFALKRKIIESNIFGVDIDQQAIEVTKFSLLLKLLENTTQDELDEFHRSTGKKYLPNLDPHIKLGNSLIDMNYVNYNPEILRQISLMRKIKPFNWEDEFKDIKFDAIVGNPPYIRVQNMVKYSPEEYSYIKSDISGFQSSSADALDKYYLFIEKALSLLSPKGMLGYIVPHKFFKIKSGEKLRGIITSGNHVCKIFHFGTMQIFKDLSTYTCILLLSQSPQDSFNITYIKNSDWYLDKGNLHFEIVPSSFLTSAPWSFLDQKIRKKLEEIDSKCVSLSSVTKIFVGTQTSADKIYIVDATKEDDNYIYITADGSEYKIEKNIIRKSIYDIPIFKYKKIKSNKYIIFPYKEENGKSHLIPFEEMKERFPFALEYLTHFKDTLEKRNMRKTPNSWYAFGRSQSLDRFINGEHLIWPVLSQGSNYVYDDECVVFTGGGNGPFYGLEVKPSTDLSIFYIQALLNYWLLELIVKNGASTFRGEYYSHGKQFIASLPIRTINFALPEEAAAHDKIVSLVKKMMSISEEIEHSSNSSTKIVLERTKKQLEKELTSEIDILYKVEDIAQDERI